VKGFNLAINATWCPPERNHLSQFYHEAKGQEWTVDGEGDTKWVDEYNDHCKWYGVRCNDNGVVTELNLTSNSLSGRISSALGNLTSLEILDLHSNNLQGIIPTELGSLMNLISARFSYNDLTGTVPSGFMHHSNLSLLHLHGNRLTGTVTTNIASTRRKICDDDSSINGTSLDKPLHCTVNDHSILVADCGSPSDFDEPMRCPNCTMCCNALGQCHVTSDSSERNKLTYSQLAGVLIGAIFVLFVLAALIVFLVRRMRTMYGPIVLEGAQKAIGNESVYSFIFSDRALPIAIAIATLFAQGFLFFIFIRAAQLDFNDAGKDWVYSYVCPRDGDCRNTSDTSTDGWAFFAILVAVHLAPDIVNALKVFWLGTKGDALLSKEYTMCFFGGLSLFSITALALYSSVVYNIAIARSDTELITNAVIILFINDLDEQLYVLLRVICPKWLDSLWIEGTVEKHKDEDHWDGLRKSINKLHQRLNRQMSELVAMQNELQAQRDSAGKGYHTRW